MPIMDKPRAISFIFLRNTKTYELEWHLQEWQRIIKSLNDYILECLGEEDAYKTNHKNLVWVFKKHIYAWETLCPSFV